ncbi:6,7-dimethyl-8-ribityllumazine synthase [Dyadobacter sp. LHD-138]|uniref:6,7-dimethyl-8-ribityllumazine synthase n=1 Tax=Dyadobacter sp. LHD-138 TaxID=3071413 RepID=UPI0027DF8371|nr:6,7-dimethyl-8-ribityllumazine synthase [Dyadobacter sp. LHD-138]MDQ6481056.1 6,7-dimethyl-8-ribityllumazine synthase [Dyadobacter sp. LHD-138]
MSSADKNLSVFNTEGLPDISNKKFAIVVAEWNSEITEALYDGAYKTLIEYGATAQNIERGNVPGSFELTLGAHWFAQRKDIDAVIALGVVIQGDTKHNDYINHAVAQGITNINIKNNKPVIFGVLTPNNMEQAIERSGGVHGNKGDEAAMTAIKMVGLKEQVAGK